MNPPDVAAELPWPADTLGREADTGMVGTEMLAPPDTDDWLLLVNDEGKLVGGWRGRRQMKAVDILKQNRVAESKSCFTLFY